MSFRTLNQCTNCEEIVDDCHNHNCPNDPVKDSVKRAEHKAWKTEFDKNAKAWQKYEAEHGDTEAAYPSVHEYPHEIAHTGHCIIIDEGDDHGNYVSSVLENPTWGEVLYLFDEAIKVTKDRHHSFMEGLYVVDEPADWVGSVPEGVVVLRFATGS